MKTLEDEAFEELERRQARREEIGHMQRAEIEAYKFVTDRRESLGAMTLKEAFEIGYRMGYSDGRFTRTR